MYILTLKLSQSTIKITQTNTKIIPKFHAKHLSQRQPLDFEHYLLLLMLQSVVFQLDFPEFPKWVSICFY